MKLAEFLKRVDVDTEADTKDMIIRNAIMEKDNARLRAENSKLREREAKIYEIKAKEAEERIVEPLKDELEKEKFKADFYEHAYDDLYVFIKSKLYQQFRMPFMSLSSTIVESIRNYIEHNHYEFDEDKYYTGGYDNYDDEDEDEDDENEHDECYNCDAYYKNGGKCRGDEFDD